MSWITLTSVTATNGQKTVEVNSGSTANIKVGDALKIGAFDIYEIEGVFANQLSLREPWGNATQTAAKAVVVPTFGDFNAAVTAMRDLADVAIGNLTAIEDWGTKAGEVTFTGKDGATYTARTLQQMDDDVAAIERQALEVARTGALEALVAISGGKWVLVTDDFGNAQCVRRVPIHTFEDLNISGCPFTGPLDCFIRQDGSYRPYVDVAVYQASSKGGKATSQADKDPWAFISADTARARCVELNANSMMMSQEIWAMLCWNMISQGFQPRGNTEYGRSHSNKNEFGRRADGRVPDDRNGYARTLTGSGPESWRHDGTIFGVADMVGNVWEWVDGMKMVSGQFIVAEYTGQPEAEWLATGVYISETGQFTSVAPSTLNSGSQVWGSMPKASGYAGNERLQRLMIEPIACTSVLSGRFYWNLDGERFPFRGGFWDDASDAGPAALFCSLPRSYTSSDVGFRSAFVS
ncbi:MULTISPECIES: hypothetical protein [unclassified Vibrio]|uniref:hypothetical protein n=1 Tax=unclassified Vibrio TaxID=2614977 RepID=UPI002929D054|nr:MULTISPECIES: hypothetical protein [unclassified Vibrio]MDU9591533.1 formylglycine-generating enzyme family protein [Vibrio sp. 2-1-2a]MDU9602728.1 formylglycine-generating enzyme family protein [Vibrio sp. 1-2-3a]